MSEQTSQWEETARLHAQNEAFYRGLLDQIGGSVGFPSSTAPHYSDLPLLVAKIAAREKLYTETVNEMAAYYVEENVPDPESQTAMNLVSRLLTLAREANREANGKGTE